MTYLRFSLDFNWQFSAQCESGQNIYSAKLSLFRGKFLSRQRDIMIQSSRFLALSRLSDEFNLNPGQENRKY